MKSLSVFLIVLLFISTVFLSCVTTVRQKASLNDFVLMNLKTSDQPVSIVFESKVIDGLIYPKDKDGKRNTGHPGFKHTASQNFKRMFNEFMGYRFSNIGLNSETKIVFLFEKLEITQIDESAGKQFLTAMFGGELNTDFIVKLQGTLAINYNGQVFKKPIIISSEENSVTGIGTGTKTSNVYRGKEGADYVLGDCLTAASNKAIMVINSYLNEIGL